ncbi:MAG: DsbA family protein [Gammaproteobacteria bacterium]
MCSWCWAFDPVWKRLLARLPESLGVVRVLGGLAPDTDQPMPVDLQFKIQEIWRTIEIAVPGTRFNFDFWKICAPRRATYAACRAVIAAAREAPELEAAMIASIQKAYYREARNPSERAVLIDLAASIGLDRARFAANLDAAETVLELNNQIGFARELGVRGFPSLVLEVQGRGRKGLEIDYHEETIMLRQILDGLQYQS